jgi:DNA-binding PucR family transcriptional regulator
MIELIKQLHRKKTAALGIKLNRYLESLPPQIITLAQELDFPIFTILTEKPTFLDIISRVYERIEKQKALQNVQEKILDTYLKEILLQENLNPKKEIIYEEAWLPKISPEKPKAIFLLQSKFFKENPALYKKICYETTGSQLVTHLQKDQLALIIEISASDNPTKEVALQKATSLQESYKSLHPTDKLIIGISSFYTDLLKLHLALVEAEKSLTIGLAVWPKGTIFHYDDLGFYRLIVNQTDSEELKAFYRDTLEPLVAYDKNNQTFLVPTLEAYLKNNGNITSTAQNLFVHYNTVKYRLEQIEELLEITLKDAEVRFNLQVALKVHQLLTS